MAMLRENVGRLPRNLLRILNHRHHIRFITVFKRLELVLPRRYDRLFRITRAHIVVLETLCARDSVRRVTDNLLGARHLAHPAEVLLTRHELRLIALCQHLLVGAIGVHEVLLVGIKGYLDPAICIPYCF